MTTTTVSGYSLRTVLTSSKPEGPGRLRSVRTRSWGIREGSPAPPVRPPRRWSCTRPSAAEHPLHDEGFHHPRRLGSSRSAFLLSPPLHIDTESANVQCV